MERRWGRGKVPKCWVSGSPNPARLRNEARNTRAHPLSLTSSLQRDLQVQTAQAMQPLVHRTGSSHTNQDITEPATMASDSRSSLDSWQGGVGKHLGQGEGCLGNSRHPRIWGKCGESSRSTEIQRRETNTHLRVNQGTLVTKNIRLHTPTHTFFPKPHTHHQPTPWLPNKRLPATCWAWA